MHLTYKYQLSPTKAQADFLAGQLKEACSLYNAAIQERREAWKICRKSLNFYSQAKQLKAMRADGCLTLVNYTTSQDVLQRVERAFADFFRRVKLGGKPGYPRYRSYRRYDSMTYPTYGKGCKLRGNGKLYVHGAGEIKINLHRPLPLEGKVKFVTLKREADRWFACFDVESNPKPLPLANSATGIDVGLTNFAVLADGTTIENPRYHRNAQARLRVRQRKVTRRTKGSNRRRKAVLLMQRAHVHVRNQRADFLHKEARKLVDKYGTIAVEDLNFKGLASSALAKSVHDAGWSMFVRMIAYKAVCAGRLVVKVDSRGTSQTCMCGAFVPKTLKDRWHECGACGLSAGRDHVSAQVILQRAGRNGPSGVNVEYVVSSVA